MNTEGCQPDTHTQCQFYGAGKLTITGSQFVGNGRAMLLGQQVATGAVTGGDAIKILTVRGGWSIMATTFEPFNEFETVFVSASGTLSCDSIPCSVGGECGSQNDSLPAHGCPAGQQCVVRSYSKWCDPCPLSQTSDGIHCKDCPAGQQPTDDRQSCSRCPPGEYSKPGSRCHACQPSFVPTEDASDCTRCLPGLEAPTEDRTECKCVPGAWAGLNNSRSCSLCAELSAINPNLIFAGPSANVLCPGGRRSEADIYPLPGFWIPAWADGFDSSLSPVSATVYPCVPRQSCVGYQPLARLACL